MASKDGFHPVTRSLFHITHVSNLPSIIRAGELWSDSECRRRGAGSQNIAYRHIKDRRARRPVPDTAGGGTLADYVPFYFAPRSPMLYAINKGLVEPSLRGRQDLIVHLVTSIEAVMATGRRWCFTDRHADLNHAQFFDGLSELPSAVSWEAMRDNFWGRSPEQRELRQAEFLLRTSMPWSCTTEIGVMNQTTLIAARAALSQAEHSPPIVIHRDWYY